MLYDLVYAPVSPDLQCLGTWIEFVSCCGCANGINLNYVGLVHVSGLPYPSTFLSIHSVNFWVFDIETPTKIFYLSA